ncbi:MULTISPECIES: hypothetical protein [Mycolicibacterium]|nr:MULTISPECIES: hypothetical protein [Mycolicibacterium]ORB14570.1 hypothetical protein BST34_22990 [Mycolicibacterium monacense DSM 44395]ORB65796.1 hypothetical protein BST47_12315 [Mycolicibacterium tusciae]
MTAEPEADTMTATDDGIAVCWRCGGPCLTYKGSVHGWTCTACLDAYLDAGAARWAVRMAKEREKNARKLLLRNDSESPVSANGRGRDGGGPDVFRTAVPASATTSDAPQ